MLHMVFINGDPETKNSSTCKVSLYSPWGPVMHSIAILILRAMQRRHPTCEDFVTAIKMKSVSTKVEEWG
jgi:hypothetical protein